MIPRPKRKIERVPVALGPMAPNRMPRKLRKPAVEPVKSGLIRFLERHFVNPKDRRP
jgi:hypothetical protein